MKPLELSGRVFGRLTVISQAEPKMDGTRWWTCQCECGAMKDARGADLRRGFIKSCGCWNNEVRSKRVRTHGKSSTRLYRIWQAMRDRTGNQRNSKFHYYGGRGISVSPEWSKFEAFYEWAMANGYEDRHDQPRREHLTIDRIDTNGNYEPTNCRWATQLVQVLNSRPRTNSRKEQNYA